MTHKKVGGDASLGNVLEIAQAARAELLQAIAENPYLRRLYTESLVCELAAFAALDVEKGADSSCPSFSSPALPQDEA